MFVIKENVVHRLTVEKSEFIALLIRINNPSEVNYYLSKAKIDYPKAKHYCYAYIYHQEKRFSDDKEPSGTAGKPLLALLENNHLDEILVIVVRYFGGILLGASRLLRTYSGVAKEAIHLATIIRKQEYYHYQIISTYEDYHVLKNYLVKNQIITTNIRYDILVHLEIYSLSDLLVDLKNKFPNLNISYLGKKYYGN